VPAASIGIGYNLPVCVFGGLSPLVLTYLVRAYDNPTIPAYYVVGAAVVSLVVVLIGVGRPAADPGGAPRRAQASRSARTPVQRGSTPR
jgi:hypothetical protein